MGNRSIVNCAAKIHYKFRSNLNVTSDLNEKHSDCKIALTKFENLHKMIQ